MPRLFKHTATITLKLPHPMSLAMEVEALRAAGIPVDAMGNAESGHLFVRRGWNGDRPNIFRWFADGFESDANGTETSFSRSDDPRSPPCRPQGTPLPA